ncbi:MAG: asparagine synthase (glutamine-hydrolyzing) [Carboxylicivirga sp.]|jgi:asparagine synthase (glutamine-hydrolysing)|nr:asparagine synthase (glutamine-hydrolyzing) [Carboxylicivirga sp.]
MCGISFILNKSDKNIDLNHQIKSMNNKILHRGPDAEGSFVYKNVGLGHRRLSIIDLSAQANQPLVYQQYYLIFNGEIYNYIELREELKKEGYTFKTNTDSEIIPAAFDKWGEDCLNKFNGMWAFLLLDTNNDKVFFARDRYGIKPLYYYENKAIISLCSEIKQLMPVESFQKQVNTDTINCFFNGELNTSKNTFFKNVFEIRGGESGFIDLETKTISIKQWYKLEDHLKDYSRLSYSEIVNKTEELFNNSLKLRLRSDVTVGSCLSGGIDSSAIVSSVKANNMASDQFCTITSTYDQKDYDETYYSDLVCDQYNIVNKKVKPQLNNFFSSGTLKRINYHQDQPIPSCSHINEYEVFKKAREEDIIVMLDGQGADEYFLGYGEFERQLFIDFLKSIKPIEAFKIFNKFQKGKTLAQKVFEFKKAIHSIIINKRQKQKYGYGLNKNCTSLAIEELVHTSIPYQLHSEDRNSMLSSVESRLPFLDYRLVEFISSIQPSLRMHQGYRKSILRDACKYLPDAIKKRRDKMGFVAPDSIFIESVSNELDKIKQDIRDLSIVNDQILDAITDDNHLFRIVSLHQWLVVFNFLKK